MGAPVSDIVRRPEFSGATFPGGAVERRQVCPKGMRGMDYSAVEKAFIDLSLRAGSVIMDTFNAPEIETVWKDDGSPVTLADMAADRLIRDGLERDFPDTLVVSEENSDSHVRSTSRFFLVDPLDGTNGFRRRQTDFTVNIALVEEGIPVMGVVHAPALGRHFCTRADGKVIERRVDPGTSSPSIVGEAPGPVDGKSSLRIIASGNLRVRRGRIAEVLDGFEVAGVDVISSSIKFCIVAMGEADLYPRFGRTMEWDTAAGQAILSAAGGRVVRFDDRHPLTYGKPGYENPEFIAYAPGIATG